MFTQIGFASFRNLMSSFGEVYDPICTEFSWAQFHVFQNFQNVEASFQIFHIINPKHVFWGLGTFWGVQQFADLVTILEIVYQVGLIRDISWSYICFRQYGISPFS